MIRIAEESLENSVIEDAVGLQLDGDMTKRNVKERQEKQKYYTSALEILQLGKTAEKGEIQTHLSEDEELEDQQKEDQELAYELGLKEHMEHHKASEMFGVEHKDDFEMLEMYNDQYPLLRLRKLVMYFFQLISFFCFKIVKHKIFEYIILSIILLNTATLINTDPTISTTTPLQDSFDTFFLWAYTGEMSLKILALGFVMKKGSYLRDGWNDLDFIIVTSSLLPLLIGKSSVNLSSLRSLRILRPLRTISSIRALKVILLTLFSAVPFLIDTFIVLFFYLLIFAIAGVQLFKGALKQRCIDPENGINYFGMNSFGQTNDLEYLCGGSQDCMPYPTPGIYGNGTYICAKMLKNPLHSQNYDTIFYSLLYMYQSCTLEGWSQTMYWTSQTISVYTFAFHLVLVFIGANILINLTLAVIKAKFTDSESKSIKEQTIDLQLDEMDEDDIEQKRIEDEKAKKKEISSDSDEEVIPALEGMKQYNREQRQKKRHFLKITNDEQYLSAGQNHELNFVFDEMMALKQKLQDESHEEAEQARQQQMLDNYMDTQKKTIQRIYKKNAKRNAKKLKPVLKVIENTPSICTPRDQSVNINSIPRPRVKPGSRRNSYIDSDHPIMRKDQRFGSIFVATENQNVSRYVTHQNDSSKNILALPSYSSQRQVIMNDKQETPTPKESLHLKQFRSEQRKSFKKITQYQSGTPKHKESAKHDETANQKGKDDFDIILQDLDDLPPMEDIQPPTKALKNDPTKKRMMLRSTRVKFDSQFNTKTNVQSIAGTLAINPKNDYSDIISNFDEINEDFKDIEFKPIMNSQNRIKVKVPDSDDGDSDDLMNDPDFLEESQINNKDHALAQAIFQKRYNSRPVKKKNQLFMEQRLKRGDPKFRGFNILGLQEHLKSVAIKQLGHKQPHDDDLLKQMQDLVLHTNDENGDYNNLDLEDDIGNSLTKSRKKDKKIGVQRDYKLVLTTFHDYYSTSKNDIMEAKLHLREKERMDRLERQIKCRLYTFSYQAYEEIKIGKKEKHQLKKKIMNDSQFMLDESQNQQYKHSRHGSEHSQQFNLRGSTLGANDFQKMKRAQTILMASGDLTLLTQSVRFPLRKAGMVRRTNFLKIQKLNIFDDIDNLLQYDKSVIKEQSNYNKTSMYVKSPTKRKRGFVNPKEEINQLNFVSIKKAMHEKLDDKVFPFELPAEKQYLQILQLDFATSIKNALHWSGDEVLSMIQPRRANKIRSRLDSSNQNSIIYLAGVSGFFKVRHNELQEFVKGKFISNFLLLVVIGNTIILSMTGSFTDDRSLALIEICNTVFTWIFITEMGIKIISFGPVGYLRDKMNIFDGSIVMLSVLEMTLLSGAKGKAVSAFRSIRIFRVLRITRLLRTMQFMGVIIKVISTTLENFIYICGLMFLFVIIYALLGMQIYGSGQTLYRVNNERADFHSFLYAFLAMFQLLTIENWDDLIQLTILSSVNKFLSMLYLISFLIIGNYVFLNLFLAILMDGFSNALDDCNVNQMDDFKLHEDQKFMQLVDDALLESHPELDLQKKSIDYLIDVEMKKGSADYNPGTLNASMQTVEEEVEVDLVNNSTKLHKPLYDGIACEDSIFIFNKRNFLRMFCYKMVMHHNFETLIQGFIMISSFKLAIDTYIQEGTIAGDISAQIDIAINCVFITEATMKILSFGLVLDDNSYLTESWSQLDFFIVCVSLIDMLFSNVNIPAIKILRLLRILRPLRFISHNVNLKTIVIALFESLGGIANVLIVVLLIWLMFAILGISLLGQRFGSCLVDGNSSIPNYGISQAECAAQSASQLNGNKWVNFVPNMDNIYNAMIMVYCLTTLEGWPNILYPAMDSDYADRGPTRDVYKMIAFYFIAFIMVSSFVLINLFTGVICYYFEDASKNEKKRGNIFLTQEQENWIEIQTMTVGVSVGGIVKKKPKNFIRAKFFELVEYSKFDAFIMVCIVMNILVMAMDYEGMTLRYSGILENINLAFTIVFICESTFKMMAYGVRDYLQSGWNKFDLFVVTTSVLDIILSLVAGNQNSFLRVGPQLIRIIRVLRVTRLLKLIKSMRSLQKLLQTLLYSLPALINIGALTLLVFFIFAILGVFLFKEAPMGDNMSKLNNFSNFGLSIVCLYRCSTGENWEWVMYDVSAVSVFAPIYFTTFLLVSTWVMLNLFTLIIIQYFENYNIKEDNPLDLFQENLEIFRQNWLKFTVITNGEKLHQKQILGFFQSMKHPLGFPINVKKAALAKEIMAMQLIGDGLGHVYFNELLYAAIKRAAGRKIFNKAQKDLNLELQIYLNKAEQETRRSIENNKNKELKRKKFKFLPNRKNPINPLVTYLFNRMVFLTWKSYSKIKQSNLEAQSRVYIDISITVMGSDDEKREEDFQDDLDDEDFKKIDDDPIEEIEEDFSPQLKRPNDNQIEIMRLVNDDNVLKRLSQIPSPLSSGSHNLASSRERVGDKVVEGQQQRIITNNNTGSQKLLETVLKKD